VDPSLPTNTHVGLAKPVLNYYASHLMESDVANGGFPQAAYNIPEPFEAAAYGYEAIGHIAAAEAIRKAHALSKREAGIVARLKSRGSGIGAVFKSSGEARLRILQMTWTALVGGLWRNVWLTSANTARRSLTLMALRAGVGNE
jgi:hypothetical protein